MGIHVSIKPDAQFRDAWARFVELRWSDGGDPPSNEQGRADENLLSAGVAVTAAGAALKLRYAMYLNCVEPYLMAAALGAEIPGMAEKIRMEDTVVETMWSTIRSLEAMAAT
jgi:hypothetical protein